MNLFWYTRVEKVEGKEGQFKQFRDSFSLDKVIRSIEIEGDQYLVLLDDLHQRTQEVPVYNKQGKQTATKNVMGTFQSEIYLQPEDAARFLKLTYKED